MFKKLLELGEQNKNVNQWKLVDTTKKMAFDIGKYFVVDKDTYQDKGIIIYDFNDGLLDKFVKDFKLSFDNSNQSQKAFTSSGVFTYSFTHFIDSFMIILPIVVDSL